MRATPARSPRACIASRLQRRVAVLLRDVVVDRLGRRVQQVAGEPHDRPVGDDVLVHRIVGPARAPAVEQAHVPVRIAFAVREPAAEEAIAARERVRRRRRRARARTARAIDAASSGDTRSSASRHSTQSCAACATAKRFCGPKPSPSRCEHARAASAARFPRYHRGCPNRRRRASAAKRADARHAAISSAASRVITTSERGSRSAMRGRGCRVTRRCVRASLGWPRDSTCVCACGAAATDERAARRPPSSLGDVVHALALVARCRARAPGRDDRLGRRAGVRGAAGAVPGRAPRRSRSRCGAGAARRSTRATWREIAAFRATRCARTRYDVILDLQEQIKGGVVARTARGVRHGFDRDSIREPVATLFDDVHHAVPRDAHFADALPDARGGGARLRARRTRRAGASLRRAAVDCDARAAVTPSSCTRRRRADKLWPEDRWRALIARLRAARASRRCCRGAATRSASAASGSRAASTDRVVPPRQSLAALAALLAQRATRRRRRHRSDASRRRARHADDRAVHADRSRRAPASRSRARTRAISAVAARVPALDEVAGAASASCCARRRAADRHARALHAAVVARAAAAAAAAVVARPARAGLSRARSASASGATRTRAALADDVLWIHAVSLGETRAAAPLIERARARASRRDASCSRR